MAGTTRGMQDGMETDGTARGITTTSTAGDTHTTVGDTHTTVGQDGTHRACITDTPVRREPETTPIAAEDSMATASIPTAQPTATRSTEGTTLPMTTTTHSADAAVPTTTTTTTTTIPTSTKLQTVRHNHSDKAVSATAVAASEEVPASEEATEAEAVSAAEAVAVDLAAVAKQRKPEKRNNNRTNMPKA